MLVGGPKNAQRRPPKSHIPPPDACRIPVPIKGWYHFAFPAKTAALDDSRIAAMKITEALFAEHLVFHSMFDHIEAAAPGLKTLAEVKSLATLMEQLLRAHSDTEDELFIGPLEHCFEQIGQRDAFLEEHKEIDENLRNIQGTRQLKKARQLLLSAVTYSRKHFDKEERIVFPMAERVLNGKTLTALGQKWMEQRTRVAV
jgi:hemerythrin-like domain-containing protein